MCTQIIVACAPKSPPTQPVGGPDEPALLKSETTATTVINPITAKGGRWHRHLHLAPIRRVVLPTSARLSTAGGTQDLVAAARAAMDEAVDRFASYGDSGVPALWRGVRCLVGWIHSTSAGWRPLVHRRFLCCYCVCSAATAGANTEIMAPTSIRSAGSSLSGGATPTPSGARGATSPDTAGSVRARRQSTRTRGDGSARLRLLPTLLGVRPHPLASGLFVLRGEGARAWAHPEGVTVVRFWRRDCRRCFFRATSP